MAEKPDKPPEKLGKYTLDTRIAAGGMAEVFLATDEAGRAVVIKRMLPNLLVDKQFARMFLDEAKLVVQLNHPSIAQVLDFGQDKGVLYLAMEYCDGTNLRLIVKDHAKRKAQIPLEYCARLVSQAAIALGYAHRAAGLDGKPLNIIHRDVSPQNILLGQTGSVKLIDFGVAKASSATQQTAAGMIKGKFAYMSPEQLRGNPLDHRSDIYGLGLVLYELLAAERAIPGSSEAEIAQNALQMKYPPIEVKRPDVPAPLKAIVARALAKDRDKRYDTAEQMAAELETFIMPRMPKLSGAEVAKILPATALATMPTSKESGSDHNPVAFWEAKASEPAQATTQKVDLPGRPVVPAAPRPPVPEAAFWQPPAYEGVAKTVINPPGLMPKNVAGPRGKIAGPFIAREDFKAIEPTSPADDVLVAPPQNRLKYFLIATAVGFVAAAAGWKLLAGEPSAPAAPPARPTVTEVKDLPNVPDPAPAPAPAPAPEPVAAPVAEPPGMAKLTLTAAIPAKVSLDGKPVGRTPVELVVGVGAHLLVFEDLGGHAKQARTIDVKANDTRTEEWKPERGKVIVRAVPWAEVFLDGKSLGMTPMEPVSLIAGRYTLAFTNKDTGKKDEKTIEVKPNLDTMVKIDLR